MQISNLNLSSRSRGGVAAICSKASRPSQLVRLIMAGIVFAAFGFVFATSANAQCDKLKTPNATLNLGFQITDVESKSNGGTYAGGGGIQPINSINCHYWVVDILVPANSSAATQYYARAISLSSGGDVPKTKAACQLYNGDSLVYLKTSEATGFQLIQKKSSKGVWHKGGGLIPSSCDVGESLSQLGNPPASGYVIYRVAGAATLGGQYTTVGVRGWHPSQPQ
jgi:hypothetical protein